MTTPTSELIIGAMECAIFARLYLDMTREIVNALLPREDFSSAADEALLLCGIFVGQAEGRPMTVTKLASYVGMPRPTVYRKLKRLEEKGMVTLESNGHALVTEEAINDPKRLTLLERLIDTIKDAVTKLSKVDTLGRNNT